MRSSSTPPAAAGPADAAPASGGATATPRLEIVGLDLRRGGRSILAGLDLSVLRGEVFGLLGPNGSGKTSLFQVLTGLLQPSAGMLRLDGRPIRAGDAAFRAQIGIVFQDAALDPRLTAVENLALAAGLYAVPRRQARERIDRLLQDAQLGDRADEPVATLSGGMRRKVELARALIHEPSFLILDEPTTGLDEGAFRRFWSDLLEMRQRRELTLLLTTHRADEAEYCDRLAVLDRGKIVACDTPDRLREQVRGDLLILSTDRPEEVARTLSARFSIESQFLDGRIVLRRERAHELIPRIVEALPEGALESISMRRTGLGEVFLELTGSELHDEQPRGGGAG